MIYMTLYVSNQTHISRHYPLYAGNPSEVMDPPNKSWDDEVYFFVHGVDCEN